MSDDIVARLRLWSENAKEQDATDIVAGLCEAADEIARLRVERAERISELVKNTDEFRETLTALRGEVETLTRERDEARRRICEDSLRMGSVFRRVGGRNVECVHGREVAEMMGWDCFKEDGK